MHNSFLLVYSLNMLKQIGRKLEVLPNTKHTKEMHSSNGHLSLFSPRAINILSILMCFSVTADSLHKHF